MSYPEPQGYANAVGFVKNNPLNNETYLEDACQAFPMWAEILRDTDERLNEVVPGYNIAQIKEKFFELRYYIDVPNDATEEAKQEAWRITSMAESTAPSLAPERQ